MRVTRREVPPTLLLVALRLRPSLETLTENTHAGTQWASTAGAGPLPLIQVLLPHLRVKPAIWTNPPPDSEALESWL